MKVSASMTESVQQQQNITETRNEEFPKRSRIAAGAERDGGYFTRISTMKLPLF